MKASALPRTVLVALGLAAASALASAPRLHAQADAAIARARVAVRMKGVVDTLRILQDTAAVETLRQTRPDIYRFLHEPYRPVDRRALSLDSLNAAYIALKSDAMSAYQRQQLGFSALDPLAAALGESAAAAAFLPQTALIAGLTDFMVERAKDEVAFGFLLTLRKHVQSEPALISTALPSSWRLVSRIDTETFQTLMPSLRSAFVEDLNALPKVVGTPQFHRAIGLNASSRDDSVKIVYLQGLSIAYARGVDLRQGSPPAVALSRLAEVTEAELDDARARQALHLVGLLAREYAAAGGAPLLEQLAEGGLTPVRRYFLALVAHDAVALDPAGTLETLGARFLERVRAHEPDAMALLNQLHSVRDALSGLAESSGTTPDQLARQVLAASGSVLQILGSARHFVVPAAAGETPLFPTFVADALHLHQALVDRDYGAIVTWLMQRPEIRLNESQLKYVSLATSLAAARSAEEVTTALRTASAPVGSFRSKRNQDGGFGPVRFSVTGYLGGSFGWEETRGLAEDETDNYLGLALPVGLELSWGIPIGSFSVFAPVVDLGAVASARLDGGQVETEPEIGWEQVFTPGIFGVFGITRVLPLSVGGGVQYVRDLRRTADGDDTVDVFRISLFVGVETTLFRF